ncbi:hypothetical protein H632_c2058p0, partial [Helicosporidium sp. ATCC 50920]
MLGVPYKIVRAGSGVPAFVPDTSPASPSAAPGGAHWCNLSPEVKGAQGMLTAAPFAPAAQPVQTPPETALAETRGAPCSAEGERVAERDAAQAAQGAKGEEQGVERGEERAKHDEEETKRD